MAQPSSEKSGAGCCSNLCTKCYEDLHGLSWTITLLLWAYLLLHAHCQQNFFDYCDCPYYYLSCKDGEGSYSCDAPCTLTGLTPIFWLVFGFMLFFYLLEFAFSPTRRYLINEVNSLVILHDILNALKNSNEGKVSIWMKVENYHYETRYRTVHSTDSQGNVQTRTESYAEVVVTSALTMYYKFRSCSDTSPNFDGLDEYRVTRLHVSKAFTFANDETRRNWNEVAEKFQDDNRNDVYQSFSYGMEIEGYQERYLCELEKGMKPWWIRPSFLYIATLLLLSPVYRLAVSCVAGRKSYQLTKEIAI